jgi:DNA replication protein DnaC
MATDTSLPKKYPESYTISGIPTYHHSSFLSNFEDKYKNKNKAFFPSLSKVMDSILGEIEPRPKYIFLCGTPGCGKTHLLVGLYRSLVGKLGYIQGDGGFFMTFSDLAQEIIGMFKDNIPLRTSLQGYTQAKYLFLDDFTSSERIFKENSLEQNIFRDILIDRYEKGYMLITTSNLNSVDLIPELDRLFGNYITSRVADSLVVQFPDIDLRRVR